MAEVDHGLQQVIQKATTDAAQMVQPAPLQFPSAQLAPTETLAALPNAATASPTTTATDPSAVSDPLDQLKDIHLPDSISFYPTALGWWLLAGIALLGLGYFVHRQYRLKKQMVLLQPATIEINQLKEGYPSAGNIAKLSALLKRISLLYFPKMKVASLKGDAWIKFLNQQSEALSNPKPLFDAQQARILTQAAYQKNPTVSAPDWQQLIDHSERWITHLMRKKAQQAVKIRPLK